MGNKRVYTSLPDVLQAGMLIAMEAVTSEQFAEISANWYLDTSLCAIHPERGYVNVFRLRRPK
jgi:hypothetical protein